MENISADIFEMDFLDAAARDGNLVEVQNLIRDGADVKNEKGKTALYWSAKNGHVKIVKVLIAAGADVDANKENGCTPLYWSAREGHTDIVKELIAAGADVDGNKEDCWTPLYWSAKNGHTDIVKELIAAGADVEAKKKYDETPLYWSAREGHTDIVKELIAVGADVDVNKEDGYTPLYLSARDGHTDIVKVLIAAGADVDVNTKDGWTPLYWSANKGHTDIVKALIAAGADVDGNKKYDDTPLYWSAREGHTDIVKVLIAAGAGIYMKETSREQYSLGTSWESEGEIVLNKYTLLCQHRLNWKLILEHIDLVFYKIWEECEEQVKKMKETCMGGSRTSIFDFITEKDKNKLAFYASEETFGLKNELERISFMEKFSIYAKDIECLFNEGRKRAILLHKCQELMMHCFCYTLPLDIVRKIIEYMSDYDIENFLVLNNILM